MTACLEQLQPNLTVNQPEGQSLPLTCQQQSRLTYNRTAYTIHTRDMSRAPERHNITWEILPLGPTGHLLHMAILLRPGDGTDLLNT